MISIYTGGILECSCCVNWMYSYIKEPEYPTEQIQSSLRLFIRGEIELKFVSLRHTGQQWNFYKSYQKSAPNYYPISYSYWKVEVS